MHIMHLTESTVNGDGRKDGYHLGHFFMDYMTKFPEDCVWQIDAATGESESKLSVKSRSIRLAICLRHAGLRPGDVAVVSGRNHLDVHIPFYAAYMNGLPLAGIDPVYKYDEIKCHFETTKPKIVFCELDNFGDMKRVVTDLELDTKLVTFGDGEHSMAKFLKMYDDLTPEHAFKVATFDTDKVFAWLISTSGTTGLPKVAAFKHQTIIKIFQLYVLLKEKEVQPALNLSSVQWISSYMVSLAMITANHVKVQSSAPITVEHAIDIINTYRPVINIGSPLLLAGIARHPKPCDMTSFKTIVVTGSSINAEILKLLKSKMRPQAEIWNLFAQTECVGPIFLPCPNGPVGNVGKELDLVQVQLVDTKTGEVILEPNTVGELWSKGPRFAEYYNNPEATAQAITPDGWYKTGDLLYRDEDGYYFYVDRMSSAFKVRRYFVMPMEVESVIKTHADVLEACVVGVPHAEDGKRAAAAVQCRVGAAVTEQEIKDLVANKLSVHKHLHGGVIFVEDFPRTVSGKIIRPKVYDMVLRVQNEYCDVSTLRESSNGTISNSNHVMK
ncbi:luciferin 4-monooxygenase-like [Leguminivora glycinivorella]|uniref:luciferin 4-monooxygenase-like n=1 Tax=Leguminivora glycinivorella TaxID=1035111 RepID=UPI00200DA00C|nr:luciferin 4-monooxygenase-like [Leguminivora glycinivorella]